MADRTAATPVTTRPFDASILALLGELAPEQSAQVRQIVRERDHLFVLHEALVEVECAASLDRQLSIFVGAIRRIGFVRAAVVLEREDHAEVRCVSEGFGERERRDLRGLDFTAGEWQQLREPLDRFRMSQSFYLDAADPWVRERFAAAPSNGVASDENGAAGPLAWGDGDVLLVPLRGSNGMPLATLVIAEPKDGRTPSLARVRTVELFGQQVAHQLEQDRLTALAGRRANRLQQLQQVGLALTRTLDEREIAVELARGASRLLPATGSMVVTPNLERGDADTVVRLVRDEERGPRTFSLATGAIGEAARRGQAVRVDAVGAAEPIADDEDPVGSVLAVPLLVGRQLLAVLAVHAPTPGAFTAEHEDLLSTVAAQAASALSNARLYAESQRERRQSEALADVARAVSESLRTGEVLRLILRHAMSLLRTEGACILLTSDRYLHVVAAAGTGGVLAGMHIPVDASISGRAIRERHPVIANDAARDPDLNPQTQRLVKIERTLVVPLITARGPIGALSVFNRPAQFAEDDALVLQRLADHVAVAIVNARLYEEVADSTREWSIAFDSIAMGMVVLDEQGRIARYNTRALQIAGREMDRELRGRQFYEAILHEARPVGNGCPLDHALTEGIVGRATVRSAVRGRLFDIVASPHQDGGAVVTFDDVTEVQALAERNRLIVETATDAILVVDRAGRIAYANPAAGDLAGRPTELIGVPMRDLVRSDLADAIDVHQSRTLDGQTQRYESVVVRREPSSEQRTVSVSQAPLRQLGEVIGVIAALRDVTDERRARDAVIQTESRYRHLLETATDAIFTVDLVGGITSANAAACELLEMSREDVLGQALLPHIAPDEQAFVIEQSKAALAGESVRYECTIIRSSGERRLVSVTNTPIRHGRRVTGLLGIARDITAERARAAALRRSEARYEKLLESASDAIFTIDQDGHFTSVNRALERSVGRTRGELIGMHFTTVIDPRDRDGLWSALAGALTGKRYRGELRYIDAHGASRPASTVASPIIENDAVTGVLGIVRDMSEDQQRVEQLLQQEKLAAIGQLVSGVAHELNNPLASVMAFSQLLLAEGDAISNERETLQTIHSEARRAARVVSNLLTFARQHPPQRSVVDVNAIVHSVLDLRRYALQVESVEIVEELDASLPETWADPFQLQQVFLNLLSNAQHAVTESSPALRRIRLRTFVEGGGSTIVVRVEDSGAGIDPAEVDRIFNPFYTTKPVGKGTGLGLSLSDGIVREHGGRIRVESGASDAVPGACFVVELPVVPPPGVARDGAASVERGADAPPLGPAEARTILVVDDEPAIRSAIARYFSSLGHTVDTVPNAFEALARISAQRYDVILLDLRMPHMSGEALYVELAALDPVHAARTIFMTGDVQSESAREFIESTGRPSVEKPFTFDDLGRAVLGEVAH